VPSSRAIFTELEYSAQLSGRGIIFGHIRFDYRLLPGILGPRDGRGARRVR